MKQLGSGSRTGSGFRFLPHLDPDSMNTVWIRNTVKNREKILVRCIKNLIEYTCAVLIKFGLKPLYTKVHCCYLPGGRKFCEITRKGPQKMFLPDGFGASTAPILAKSGRKGAGTFQLLFFFFRAVWTECEYFVLGIFFFILNL